MNDDQERSDGSDCFHMSDIEYYVFLLSVCIFYKLEESITPVYNDLWPQHAYYMFIPGINGHAALDHKRLKGFPIKHFDEMSISQICGWIRNDPENEGVPNPDMCCHSLRKWIEMMVLSEFPYL